MKEIKLSVEKPQKVKLEYITPVLTDLGSIVELTLGCGGSTYPPHNPYDPHHHC